MERERFNCPECGAELTNISLELNELRKGHDRLEKTFTEILARVFDNEELKSISDRLGNKEDSYE